MLGLDPDTFARLQARVIAQDRVRIRTRSGRSLIITRPYLTANELGTLATSARPDSTLVDLRDVTVIDVPGSSADKGAMVGAAIGFVPGFLAGMALAGFCINFYGECSEPDPGERLRAGAIVGAGGAAIGTLLGAAIGASIEWKTVYRAEQVPARSAHLSFAPHPRKGLMLAASIWF